ncbi:MAG: hypothetical protein ACOCW8_01065 [bacterium]
MGVSEKSFTRTIKEFHHDGLIQLDGRHVKIIKHDLLKRLNAIG